MDRIDLHVDVPRVLPADLTTPPGGDPSAAIRAWICAARERQIRRFAGRGPCNALMTGRQVRRHCRLEENGKALLHAAIERLGLSARGYERALRVARTIADLDGSEEVTGGTSGGGDSISRV